MKNASAKISVMHFKNINIKLFYTNYANKEHFSIFKKMNSKVQKWIYFNV